MSETETVLEETTEKALKPGQKSPKTIAKLEEEGDIAADYLEGLLDIADLDGDIDIDVENDRAAIAILGGKLNHLVGSGGEVLDALQELTRLAVQTSTGDRSRLMLDIEGFRSGRKSELKKLAEEMADQAKSTGEEIRLKPMNAFERKVIHDTIQDLGLSSESEGEDPDRFVVIFPNQTTSGEIAMEVSRETALSREEIIQRYFPNRQNEIKKYAEFLVGPGIERGLIGPREGDRIWERHIFNCLPVSTLIPEGCLLFDIGSGAGLPGLVIALARPDLKINLIEPLARRVEFLEEAIALLEIENVAVIRGKSENVKKSANYVTARAVAPLEKLKKITSHMIKPGGALLAMKGESAAEEAKTVPNAEVIEVNLPGLELGRIIKVAK